VLGEKTVSAIIPVRAGSVRIKNKNLMEVNGDSLIVRKIKQLKRSRYIDKINVGTNCEISAMLAEQNGAEVIWREDYFCDETKASANEMIGDLAVKINSDVMVWSHCTNPFTYATHYDSALEVFGEKSRLGYDSVVSVYRVQSHMWGADARPANFDPWGPRHPLAKDLQPVFFQDGGIFIQSALRFRETSYFYGSRPWLFEVEFPYCHDINTPDELEFSRYIAAALDEKFSFD